MSPRSSNAWHPLGDLDEVVVRDSVDAAAAAGWDSLVDDSELYSWAPWLRVEGRLIAEQRSFLMGSAGGALVAGLTAVRFDRGSPPWPFARVDALLREQQLAGSPGEPGPDEDAFAELLPDLLLGGRRPGHTRLLLAGHLDPPARLAVSRSMLAAAERLAAARGAASLSMLFVDEGDEVLRESLAAAGYARFPSAITSSLAVPPSFDDYIDRFPSRRRNMVRRDRRRLEEAGVTYELRPLSRSLIEAVLPLELDLYRKHGNLFPAGEARRFHELVLEDLGPHAHMLVATAGGAVRGFVALVRRGDTLYTRQCGFDYRFQGTLPLYFGLLFYAVIEHAQRTGARRIEYGIGSDEAKALRGCQQWRQHGYVKMLDPGAHGALLGRLPRG